MPCFAGPPAIAGAFSTGWCSLSIPAMAAGSRRWSARRARATGCWMEGGRDPRWLDAVEREIAELGIAVAVARAETVTRLAALIARARDDASPFPDAGLALEGETDTLVSQHPALEAEDAYRERPAQRALGATRAAGRTLFGPQDGAIFLCAPMG